MSLKIRISNLNKKRRIDAPALRKAALRVLRAFGKREALIDITFVGNRRITALNKKYMGRRRSTDVLSFLLEEGAARRKSRLIGDIYISSDAARPNARRFKTAPGKEIFRYVIHGILHLVGFSDKTVKEKKRIRELEEKYLKWHSKG